jgi:uncharacterized membrane protein
MAPIAARIAFRTMGTRAQAIDVARGGALVAMIVYHACWFATDAGLVALDLQAPGWHLCQRSIAASFFLLVGVSLALARPTPVKAAARIARIAACALLVTAASVVLDPQRVVTFGILHNIAVSSLVALPALRLGAWNVLVGTVLVALGAFVSLPDHPLLDWTGLGGEPAPTFDFQPLLPWLGVVLWGAAIGTVLRRREAALAWHSDSVPARALALLGRHSLLVYMAHVPILVGTTSILAGIR